MELRNKGFCTGSFFNCILLGICGVIFFIHESNAQLFPVQVTPQLVPPYSVYLSDYAAPGSEKLRVIILQRDLTQPSYQLRLVMSVELNGKIMMRTAKAFNPLPLNIDPGVPTIISGTDLAPYVDSRNIDFVGYSREQYERTRALPEGSYRIMFTAYDYHRQDVQVSNEGSSFYYLSKNEPPLINFPACGTKIPRKDPQQIVFSWLPRNTSSPTSAADTEYEFSLYETRPSYRNPNDVINTTQPIFKTRTDITTLVYGPSEPQLFDEMKYVWRVQAIDKSGRDAFRNNGYSEVCTFTYGGADPTFDIGVVKNLQAVGETDRRAKISWEASNYDGYKVYYKKTGAGYEWFWSNVSNNELKLGGLEPDTEYETRVQVKKSGVFGSYSEIIQFKTRPKEILECGQATVQGEQADESKPLLFAQPGMTFDAEGMKVTLVDIQNLGGGWFKGIGTTSTKLLGGASFYVKFDRLFLDESLVAGYGRIDVVNRGVAEMVRQQMANAILKDKQAQQQTNREQWSTVLFQPEIFKYDEIITDVHFDLDALIITDNEGNTSPNTEIPQLIKDAPEKAIIIEDKNGDQWVVQKDSNGENKVTKVPGGGLVVGPDGKIVNEKALSGLYRKILKALRKYQKAIDGYQASIKQTQPGKGGGPSLFEYELEMLESNLPPCLDEYKEHLSTISTNIKTYLDSGKYKSVEFGVDVAKILEREFPTSEDRDNASQDKVDEAVCVALVGQFYKTFFNSKYVIVGNMLKKTAWGTTKGKDEFMQDIVTEVDSKLERLDKDTLKTLIHFNSIWVHRGNNNEASLEKEREKMLNESKEKLAKDLGYSSFNLLVVVISKYDTALNKGVKKSKFNEAFYPMDGLDSLCVKSVRDYINSDSKKQWNDGLDDALIERAEKLLEKLKGCKVERPREIVVRYRRKGRNQYRTWGEFTIDGTEYKGYILERPKGSSPTKKQDCMRHPSGTYEIVYSNSTNSSLKFRGFTMCLSYDSDYKLHGGNRVDNSDGCFLINKNSPQFDKYPEAFQSIEADVCIRPSTDRRENPDKNKYPLSNPYFQHYDEENPAYKLRNKIESMESEIKKTFNVKAVKKIFIIDDQDEKVDP